MADFPDSIYSPRTMVNRTGVVYDKDKTKVIYAEDFNNDRDEIVAIENTLGLNPNGAYTTVSDCLDDFGERLVDVESNLPTLPIFERLGITIDGAGSEITTGFKGFIHIPYSGTIKAWTLLADVSGSCVIDIWKDTYANFPPTDADSITNSHEPEISLSQNAQDTDLSDWLSVTLNAGDVIGFNVDSASTVTRVMLSLTIERT